MSLGVIQNELHNISDGVGYVVHHSPYHSVWSLLKNKMNSMVNDAMKQASQHFNFSDGLLDTMKSRLNNYLGNSLADVAYDHQLSNQSLSSQIKEKVGNAVDSTVQGLSMNVSGNFTHKLFTALDTEIELDTFGEMINGSSNRLAKADIEYHAHQGSGGSDSTLVVLVCVGVLVPIIIFTMLGIYMYRRRLANKGMRHEMLLTEQSDFVDDPQNEEDVPDLNFRNMRI